MYHDQHNTRPWRLMEITRNSEGADNLEDDGIAAGSASVAASSCQDGTERDGFRRSWTRRIAPPLGHF